MCIERGLTNRRIAAEPFTSERTVDHHVSNFKKLPDPNGTQVP
jgi:DNA-binding NarL/FixJ family response regulator